MRKIGETSSGNILIEISDHEWQQVLEHNSIRKDLSVAVAEYRRKNGLTQMELAQKIGISRTRVQEIERGLSRNMRLLTYERVLSAMA